MVHQIKVHPENIQDEPVLSDPPPIPTARGRVCAECGYDLDRLETDPICPECGKQFDPLDPSTTMSRARYQWRGRLRGRWGFLLAVALFLFAAGLHGFLPAPRTWRDPRLWTWLGYDFGILQSNATQKEYEVEYRWAGRTLRIERWTRGDAVAGTKRSRLWWATRHGVDEFELSVEALKVPSGDLVRAIGAVRYDEMLGVRIGAGGLAENGATFRVRGSKAAVLSELISRYQLSVVPFKLTDDQTHVWLFDEEQGTLVYVPVSVAQQRFDQPIQTRFMWEPGRGRRVRAVKPAGGVEGAPVSVTPPKTPVDGPETGSASP